MAILRPDWPALPANVGCLTTLRHHGVSARPYDDGFGDGGFNLGLHVGDERAAVLQNRRQLRESLPAEPAWLTQIHGTTVRDAAAVVGAPEADASFATTAGVVCAVLTADCLPVLLCDATGLVVAAAHAGWRGLAGGVLVATVDAMRQAGADEILAWLGPAIGPERFEVGAEVREKFIESVPAAAQAFVAMDGVRDKYLANIYTLARLALQRSGVDQIVGGDACTVIERERYFSYRRDGRTGRMASMIWIK